MVCKQHNELTEKLNKMAIDIAVIKNSVSGDNSALSELKKKVDSHDKWFYIAYGCLLCVGYAMAQIGILVKL